jgi:hypothetical protein
MKCTRRLLIFADGSCGLPELRRGAHERSNDHTAIRLVVPLKMSREWFRDEGEARRSAREELDEILDGLRRDGVTATGQVGSADPEAAIEEALADFPADEIMIFTGPRRGVVVAPQGNARAGACALLPADCAGRAQA